jgi:hypothetical protein
VAGSGIAAGADRERDTNDVLDRGDDERHRVRVLSAKVCDGGCIPASSCHRSPLPRLDRHKLEDDTPMGIIEMGPPASGMQHLHVGDALAVQTCVFTLARIGNGSPHSASSSSKVSTTSSPARAERDARSGGTAQRTRAAVSSATSSQTIDSTTRAASYPSPQDNYREQHQRDAHAYPDHEPCPPCQR